MCFGMSPDESPSDALSAVYIRGRLAEARYDLQIMIPLKKVNREKRTGICGGTGQARTPTYTPPYSSSVVFSVHSDRKIECFTSHS